MYINCPCPPIITSVCLRVIQNLKRSSIFAFLTQFCSDETNAKMPQRPFRRFVPYLGDSIPDNPGELAYNETLHRHGFSFQGKNAPATVSGKTPTERLHNAWLKLQTDVNCCIDSDLDKLSTIKFPGIRQVCVCVCFQVDCSTGMFETSFNLANLY